MDSNKICGKKRWTRLVLFVATVGVALTSAAPAGAATGWAIVPTPNPGTANTIGGIVTFGPSETWAIGQTASSAYTGCHGRTLALRYDGAAFREVTTGQTPICASVEGVAGTSTSDIWGVGSTNNRRDTHIRRWNGNAWAVVPGAFITVPPSGGRQQRSTGLNAVAARTTADVWAVGRAQYSDFSRRALIERWNGSSWSLVNAPGGSGSVLDGVVALGANDAWTVGKTTGGQGTVTLIEHWNGTSWSVVPSPNTDVQNALHGIATVSSSNLWAVGEATASFTNGVSTTRTLIQRWDGSTWSVVPSPNVGAGNNALAAVVARSANDVWAVGYFDELMGDFQVRKTLTLHWNGTSWAVVPSANGGTGDNWLSDVASASGTSTVWSSGVSAPGTLIEKFSG
jgi:hypothetical protein